MIRPNLFPFYKTYERLELLKHLFRMIIILKIEWKLISYRKFTGEIYFL